MSKYINIVFWLFVSFQSCSSQLQVTKEQKQLMAKLTGAADLDDHQRLESRHSQQQRRLTAEYLKSRIEKLRLEPLYQSYEYDIGKMYHYVGKNVYTFLPSTVESEEYVVLGAHYDTVENSPGANDNATGVVMAYTIVQRLQKLKTRRKNVILVFFDQEEKGLIGSKAFAQWLQNQPFNVHSVHTIDQMGWDKDGDEAIELELPTASLKELYTMKAAEFDVPVWITKVSSTDHQAFRELGFDAIGITEEYKNKDTTPHYHRPTDTYETVDFNYLLSSTNVVFGVLAQLLTE